MHSPLSLLCIYFGGTGEQPYFDAIIFPPSPKLPPYTQAIEVVAKINEPNISLLFMSVFHHL